MYLATLVISEAADWSADAVVNELRHRNVPVFRLDTGDFPQRMRVSARLRDGWAGLIGTDAGDLDLSMVAGVYYRRPRTFDLPNGLSGPERRFAQQQARVGIGGLLASLPTLWINHPSAIADCEYKPRQLAVAASVGFTTPATLITNDPDAVRDFAADIGDLVVKPFADPLVHEAGDTSIVYTRRLRPADLVHLSGVETTAHLFQQWVEPQPCAVRAYRRRREHVRRVDLPGIPRRAGRLAGRLCGSAIRAPYNTGAGRRAGTRLSRRLRAGVRGVRSDPQPE